MDRRLSSSSTFSGFSLSKSGKRRGGQGADSPATFDRFVSEVYLPHARQHKRSWAVDERIARQHLSAAFGDRYFAGISRSDVEYWLQGLSEKGLAPATCNRILAVLKKICSLAQVYGIFPSGQSPCSGISSFKILVFRERCLTDEQARRLMRELERSPRREARAVQLLMLTGARKSEILKARWECVNFEQQLLAVPLSKSGRPRHLPLSDAAVAVIRSLPREDACPWLFPGRAPGKPLSDLYLFWDKLRRKLGLSEVRLHDLRHTFASLLVNAGHSLYEVQKLLGHNDPRTTMRYAHLGQASLLAATQTVSTRLGVSCGRLHPKSSAGINYCGRRPSSSCAWKRVGCKRRRKAKI